MPSDPSSTSQMPLPSRWRLIAIALICGIFGLFSAAVCAVNFPRHPAVGQDWMVFYTAARAYLDGNLSLLYDADRLTAHMEVAFADWLAEPLGFHPWVYPPPFLLLLIPFGTLSFGLSYPLFVVATFGCLLAAIWRLSGAGYRPWDRSPMFRLALSSPKACPAAPKSTLYSGKHSKRWGGACECCLCSLRKGTRA